jgi:YHS domain-containing protein
MLANLLRFLFVLFFLRILLRFVHALIAGYRTPETTRSVPQRGIPLVHDHICNTFLPEDRALRTFIAGQEAFFCSQACRERALTEANETRSEDEMRNLPPSRSN